MADARVAEVRRMIDGLRRDRRQHRYRGRGEYSERAQEVAGAIAEMIESGRAPDAVPLARRAVERITDAMLHMDDSSGIIGGDLRILTALYARACRAGSPAAVCRADLPVLVRSAKALPRGGDGSAVPDRRGPSDRLTAGVLLAIRVPIGPAAA